MPWCASGYRWPMATPTVHSLCLDLARETTSRVERYLLLRLALRAERTDFTMNPLALTVIGALVPSIGRAVEHLAGVPRPATAPAN